VNVLFFSHTSLLGGAERSLLRLVEELTLDHNTMCTVVLPNQGPLGKLLVEAGASIMIGPIHWWCTVDSLPTPDEVSRQYGESLSWLNENQHIFKKINPDIILTNTMVIPWGAFAALILKRPHIWMINEFGILDHGLDFFLPFTEVLEFIESSSDKIITRSNAIRNELFPHLQDSKVQTIYRDIEIPENVNNPLILKDDIYFHPNALRLIIIGTISEAKGQEDAVISVIELVKNRNRCVELVIVGKDQNNYQNYLQGMIDESKLDDYIHIMPFQENIFPFIEQADVVLICSRMEAFGRVILEGMLMGKAIIATNTGGTPELITEGETGLLYSPGNYLELANQIEKLIDDPPLIIRLATKGKQFAKITFTNEQFSGVYNQLFLKFKNENKNNRDKILIHLTLHYQKLLANSNLKIRFLTKEIEETEKEVLDLVLSKSWRITRPIRKIMRIFKARKNA